MPSAHLHPVPIQDIFPAIPRTPCPTRDPLTSWQRRRRAGCRGPCAVVPTAARRGGRGLAPELVRLAGPEHPGGVELFVIEFQTPRGMSAPYLVEGGDFVHAGGQEPSDTAVFLLRGPALAHFLAVEIIPLKRQQDGFVRRTTERPWIAEEEVLPFLVGINLEPVRTRGRRCRSAIGSSMTMIFSGRGRGMSIPSDRRDGSGWSCFSPRLSKVSG